MNQAPGIYVTGSRKLDLLLFCAIALLILLLSPRLGVYNKAPKSRPQPPVHEDSRVIPTQ